MIIKDIGLKEAENIRKVLNFSNFRLISCTIILTYIKNVKSYTWGNCYRYFNIYFPLIIINCFKSNYPGLFKLKFP